MPSSSPSTTVHEVFFQPLADLAAQSSQARSCPEFADADYVLCGVQRVLEASPSGRGFLQEHGPKLECSPSQGNYFATLHSERRLKVLTEVCQHVRADVDRGAVDRLAHLPELERYDCFAADGHWHKAAAHDARHENTKMAVGHFYSLSLRTHRLTHLATGQGLHEHDMTALKRVKPKGLRQGVAKGRRVLIVYDKAGIDFGYWKRCRQECAVYFLSRVKENMVLSCEQSRSWDTRDPRNQGVEKDEMVRSSEGHRLRVIVYADPVSGQSFEFVTNDPDLPPGVLAELYRRRWNVEKVFDEIKNKLGQIKAWASSLTAKEAQAKFIELTYNLLLIYERDLERRHGITPDGEDRRRDQRRQETAQAGAAMKGIARLLILRVQRATQHSVKFIRWLRHALDQKLTEAVATARLRLLYAAL